eukprot:6942646-Pyramimonas_sp.AAC.1
MVTFHAFSGAKVMVTSQLVTVVDDSNGVHFSESAQQTARRRRRRSLLQADSDDGCAPPNENDTKATPLRTIE